MSGSTNNKAGRASAKKRAQIRSEECELERSEEAQYIQQKGSTPVERPSDHKEADTEKEKKKND
ncbi:hypothetical protein [Microvirga makkahensis]|uniref:Uncharacterized protein n=1 Tax=Microvirga makkahensis TaxID=1128670 RepID=A0A7X3SRA8_9HYPH|nr:hypothetical protein [Microvirga makkahensis]MXQ13954.1 hypothetical protein [Microvirga makkahensis]